MDRFRGLWRGKRINGSGAWVKGLLEYRDYELSSAELYNENDCEDFWVDPSTLGECTGLRDKNGKLIFEGDIVHVLGGEHYNGVYECDEIIVIEDITDGVCVYMEAAEYIEVVGNIHDNPELLNSAT